MTDAVIVSTARTGLAKSWRGGFNMTHGATLGGHATQAAVERARIDPARVEDVIMGCANPEGATGGNIARQIALRAGITLGGTLPVPTHSSCIILRNTLALVVHEREIERGQGMALISSPAIPLHCLSKVPTLISFHTFTKRFLRVSFNTN